jgi:membrane protease YdiL (CAAX protease family)
MPAFGRARVAAYPGTVSEPDQFEPRPVEPSPIVPLPPPPPAARAGEVDAPAGERPVRWGFGDAIVGWIIGIVGGAIAYEFVLGLSGTDRDNADDLPIGWIAIAQLGLWFGLLGTPWLVSRFKGNGMRRDFGLTAKWVDLPVGALWGLIGQFGILLVVYLPMSWLFNITRDEFSEPAQEMSDRATNPIGVVLLVLIVGVGAPVVEEIFYRGLVQRSLINRFGPVWGIGLASVIFGAVHFQGYQLPALALAGLLFGLLAYRAQRLGPAIFAHMVFNLAAVASLLSES